MGSVGFRTHTITAGGWGSGTAEEVVVQMTSELTS